MERKHPPASRTARGWTLIAAAFTLVGVGGRCAAAETASQGREERPSPMEVIVLGSGGPAALGRASSGYLVQLDGVPRILVDAGSGSFARVGEIHASLDALDIVLLTHLHVDHAAELPGFIKARAVSASGPIHFEVYGPTGRAAHSDSAAFPSTRRFITGLFGINGAFAYLKDFSAPVSFAVTDLPASGAGANKPHIVLTRPNLAISAIGGHHGDAPAIIYRIDYHGHSVVFSGDIDPLGLPALATIARGANLLVFDAVVLDPPASPEVLYSLHSPPMAIGVVADRSQVGALLLSHLSPAVEHESTAVAASIASHYRGSVKFAADGMRLQP